MADKEFVERMMRNGGVPILGQPQTNGSPAPAAKSQTVVMHTANVGWTLGTDEHGESHALLTFQFVGPKGESPTIVLILQDDELLRMPDALRKIIREGRARAQVANLDSQKPDPSEIQFDPEGLDTLAGETTEAASDIPANEISGDVTPDVTSEPGPADG